VRAIAGSGAGFLLAVLWFDLMFDVQARGHTASDVPADIRASIAAYYACVTTAARPMNRLVPLAMVTTIAAQVAELVRNDLPVWRASLSLGLTFGAVGLAAGPTRSQCGASRAPNGRRRATIACSPHDPARPPGVPRRDRRSPRVATAPCVIPSVLSDL